MTSDTLLARLDGIAAARTLGYAAKLAVDLRAEVYGDIADGHTANCHLDPFGYTLVNLNDAALPAARAAIKASRTKGVFGFAGIPLVLILQTLLPILLPIILQVLALLFAKKPAMLAALTSPAASDIDLAVRLAVEGEAHA